MIFSRSASTNVYSRNLIGRCNWVPLIMTKEQLSECAWAYRACLQVIPAHFKVTLRTVALVLPAHAAHRETVTVLPHVEQRPHLRFMRKHMLFIVLQPKS